MQAAAILPGSYTCYHAFKTTNMDVTKQIAKHFREVYFGGNWTTSNLEEQLKDITWQQATTQVYSFNSIATLVYHINYYVSVVLKVFQGEALNASDKYSFDHPPIQSQEDWERLLDKTRADAKTFAEFVEALPDSKLDETFVDEKYGTYYRNLHGIIEHFHYHLGQVVLIKKIILQAGEK
jgi:uncharacterized damage-inducible protein DinB